MKILVDADSCPVKDEVLVLAREFNIEAWLIASVNHCLPTGAGARVVQVDDYPEAVDLAVISRAEPGDVVVTGDYGLAALALGSGCRVISPRGRVFQPQEADRLLASRHLARCLKRGGQRIKGPAPFKPKDRQKFLVSLSNLLRQDSKNK